MATKKYRPYLTLPELQRLCDVLRANQNITDKGLILYLEKYIFDIRFAFRIANHTSAPSTLERLSADGKENPNDNLLPPNPDQMARYTNGEMGPEESKAFEESQGIRF